MKVLKVQLVIFVLSVRRIYMFNSVLVPFVWSESWMTMATIEATSLEDVQVGSAAC